MIAKEGFSTLLVGAVPVALFGFLVSVSPAWWSWLLLAVFGAIFLLLLYFFRDPERTVPSVDEGVILSPADGKVVLIQETEETEYIHGKAIQISIFLSPLDVHVNRNPVSGLLEYLRYYPGKYLMAWEDHASELNERAHFGVRLSDGTKILFKQITGFLARRIVYHTKEGDDLKAGARFGIMKFGSRMDVLVPPDFNIHVQKGDRTVAGESIIAKRSS
ncbi:MAG: phosphatidylserine decarboxylase family protein [Balneolaceae bacterium]